MPKRHSNRVKLGAGSAAPAPRGQQEQQPLQPQQPAEVVTAATGDELERAFADACAVVSRVLAHYRQGNGKLSPALHDWFLAAVRALAQALLRRSDFQITTQRRQELWLPLLQLSCYSSRRLLQLPVYLTGLEPFDPRAEPPAAAGGGRCSSRERPKTGAARFSPAVEHTAAVTGAALEHRSNHVANHLLTRGLEPTPTRWGDPPSLLADATCAAAAASVRALLQGHMLRVHGLTAAGFADAVAKLLQSPPASAAVAAAAEAQPRAAGSPTAAAAAGGGATTAGASAGAGSSNVSASVAAAYPELMAMTLATAQASQLQSLTEAGQLILRALKWSNETQRRSFISGTSWDAAAAARKELIELLLTELTASGYLEHAARLALTCARVEGLRSASSSGSSGNSSSAPDYLARVLVSTLEGLCSIVTAVMPVWVSHSSSAGAPASSPQQMPAPPPPPWGACLRCLSLSQVVVTLEAAGYGGGVRGVWGLPEELAAGLPVLGPKEGSSEELCDLRPKLRRHEELQQLVRAHRQQQQQQQQQQCPGAAAAQPPAPRAKAPVFVLHQGCFEVLVRMLAAEVGAATAPPAAASAGTSGWPLPISRRAAYELVLGVAELAASVPPEGPKATPLPQQQQEQPQLTESRPRLCLPQSAVWDMGFAALALAKQLRRPRTDGCGGYPRMSPRWWRAVVALMRGGGAPAYRNRDNELPGTLSLKEVWRTDCMPGSLLPPRVPPALEVALAAGLVPALEAAVRRAKSGDDAVAILAAAFQIRRCGRRSTATGSSWPVLQQLLAFAPPAQTAALITSLGRRAHAELDAAGTCDDDCGEPRLGVLLLHALPVSSAVVSLLPPSPWARVVQGAAVAASSDSPDGGSSGSSSCTGRSSSSSGSGLKTAVEHMTPQQLLHSMASARAAAVRAAANDGDDGAAAAAAAHAAASDCIGGMPDAWVAQVGLEGKGFGLLPHALHRWLPALARCVQEPALSQVSGLDCLAASLQPLLLWVQPALLALLGKEDMASTCRQQAAQECRQRDLLSEEAQEESPEETRAGEQENIAFSWRQWLLRDVDVVGAMGVGLAALRRAPPDDPDGARLSSCLLTALAVAALAVPDALRPVLLPPAQASGGSGDAADTGPDASASSSPPQAAASVWQAGELRSLLVQRLVGSGGVGSGAGGSSERTAEADAGQSRDDVTASEVEAVLAWVEELRAYGAATSASAGTSGGSAPAAAATAGSFLGGVRQRLAALSHLMLHSYDHGSAQWRRSARRQQQQQETGCWEPLVYVSPLEISCERSWLPWCCANPRCADLAGDSELGGLVKEGDAGPAAAGATAGVEIVGSSTSSSSSCAPCRGRYCQLCAGCRAVSYCSRRCQAEHWAAGHREACGRMAASSHSGRRRADVSVV